MKRQKEDPAREERIAMEIVVDAYGPEERAMGWYYHLESALRFPFLARCASERMISPLHIDDEVEAIGMPPEKECEHEMFVTIRWEERGLAVPLAQLRSFHVDAPTREAVEDWLYWVRMGYEF